MPVYDRSYRRWDGELKVRWLRWWPIATSGIQQAIKYRGKPLGAVVFYGFLMVSLVPFLVLLLLNYGYNFPPAMIADNPDVMRGLEALSQYKTVQYYTLVFFSTVSLKIFTVVFGAGLIARDRSAMALPLYLSRPLTMADYLAGKMSVVAFFLACLTLIPSLILYLFDVSATDEDGYFRKSLPVLWAIFVHTGSIVLLYSATILGVSSFCKRPQLAGLIWFALVVILPNTMFGIALRLRQPALAAISPMDACNAIAHEMYDLGPVQDAVGGAQVYQGLGLEFSGQIPFHWALLSMIGFTVLGIACAWYFVRRQDVAGDGK